MKKFKGEEQALQKRVQMHQDYAEDQEKKAKYASEMYDSKTKDMQSEQESQTHLAQSEIGQLKEENQLVQQLNSEHEQELDMLKHMNKQLG